jgi:putative transposase
MKAAQADRCIGKYPGRKARRLVAQAIELEAEAFLEAMKEFKLADGRDRLVLHGHGPQRAVRTGIAPVEMSRVKIRDRGGGQ